MTRPAPSRRGLFGAAAGVFLASPLAAASPGTDAELIGLCQEYVALLDAEFPIYDMVTDGMSSAQEAALTEPLLEPLERRQCEIIDRICELPTRTLAGFVARGRAYERLNRGDDTAEAAGLLESTFIDQRQIGALIRDLVAVGERGA